VQAQRPIGPELAPPAVRVRPRGTPGHCGPTDPAQGHVPLAWPPACRSGRLRRRRKVRRETTKQKNHAFIARERIGGKTPSQLQSGTRYKAPATWIADEMGLTRRHRNAVPRVTVFLADSAPAAAALSLAC
jgi:hypothetical protein